MFLPEKVILCAAFVCLITIAYNRPAMSASKSFIVDVYMGEPVTEETMLDDMATVKIIYLGEIHTIPRHHALEAKILRELSARNLKLALGMEMFSHEQQPVLDRWQKEREGISALIRALGQEGWTNLKDYETLLTEARELNIPILGLNATDKLVKKVARKGLDGLTDAEKKQIPGHMAGINPLYDRLLRLRLKVHRAFLGKGLDFIVEAQCVRDQTMAWNLSRYLELPGGKDRIMFVVAGSGHVNYGLGIPERGHRMNGLPFRIIIPTESGQLKLSQEERRQSVPINISHTDLRYLQVPIADYLDVLPLKENEEPPAEWLSTSADPRSVH
jgi:uncharacterized iron-regulated protein